MMTGIDNGVLQNYKVEIYKFNWTMSILVCLTRYLLNCLLIFHFNLLSIHEKYIYKCLFLWKIPLSLPSSLEINVSLLRTYFNELSGDWLSWGCVRLPAKLIEQFSSRRAAREAADRINYNWHWECIPFLPDCPCLGHGTARLGSAAACTSIMAKKKLYARDVYGTLTFEYL